MYSVQYKSFSKTMVLRCLPEMTVSILMRRHTLIGFTALLLLGLPVRKAAADIFQYTDDQGVIHFSNVDAGKGKKSYRIKREMPAASESARGSQAFPSRRSSMAESASPVRIPPEYVDIINQACDRHGVDPALVHAIVKVESGFNPYALSRKGAMGLMQLMPQTAVDMNVHNSFSPTENIDGGVKYLRYLIDRYEGNLSLALAAYNSGETAVKKWGTVPPFRETQQYVQRILKLYNGTGETFTPRYTIYIGYDENGGLLLTDDPSKQKTRALKAKPSRRL